MPNPPPGYTPIPDSTMGGYSKMIDGVCRFWYPKNRRVHIVVTPTTQNEADLKWRVMSEHYNKDDAKDALKFALAAEEFANPTWYRPCITVFESAGTIKRKIQELKLKWTGENDKTQRVESLAKKVEALGAIRQSSHRTPWGNSIYLSWKGKTIRVSDHPVSAARLAEETGRVIYIMSDNDIKEMSGRLKNRE